LANARAFSAPGKARWPEEFNTPSLIQELEAVLRVWESNLPDTLRRDAARRFMAARRPLLSPEETAKLEKELESVPVNRAAVDEDAEDKADKDDKEDDKSDTATAPRKTRKKSAPKTGTIGIRSFSDGSQHQPD